MPRALRSAISSSFGRNSIGSVQPPRLFEEAHEARFLVEELRAEPAGDRQRLRLEVVVAQDERSDVVGHLREHRVALLLADLAVGNGEPEQDLDVDLVVRRVDAGRVVDRVGVDAHAVQRRLDAPALREAEVAAFADHLAAQIAAVDAHAVVGAVADLGVRFRARLDVGADAAVVEQVHGRFQDGAQQLGRRESLGRDAERRAGRGERGIDFSARAQTPPPAEISDVS